MYNFKINGIYHALHKFFIEVKADMIDIPEETNIYGLVMEGIFWREEQSLLACYSNGFVANYMISQGGKVGKYYREGDLAVISDVVTKYQNHQLQVDLFNVELNDKGKELAIMANENIGQTKLLRPNSVVSPYFPNTTRIWLLAKDGVYYTEVEDDKLEGSLWDRLVAEAKKIINDLYDFVPNAF